MAGVTQTPKKRARRGRRSESSDRYDQGDVASWTSGAIRILQRDVQNIFPVLADLSKRVAHCESWESNEFSGHSNRISKVEASVDVFLDNAILDRISKLESSVGLLKDSFAFAEILGEKVDAGMLGSADSRNKSDEAMRCSKCGGAYVPSGFASCEQFCTRFEELEKQVTGITDEVKICRTHFTKKYSVTVDGKDVNSNSWNSWVAKIESLGMAVEDLRESQRAFEKSNAVEQRKFGSGCSPSSGGAFSGGEDLVDELDRDLQILEVKFSKFEKVLTLMQQSDDADTPPKWFQGVMDMFSQQQETVEQNFDEILDLISDLRKRTCKLEAG